MKYYKISFLLFFFMIFYHSYSQTPAISSDTVLINLTITTQENKNLETEIFFENLSSHKTKIYKSNKEGKVNCVLSTGESYQIKIPNSDDTYEYSIPDFSISPLQLTFKFSRKENVVSSFGIRFFNNNPSQRNFILKSKSSSTPYKVTNDTAHIKLNPSEEYSILINEVIIKNNSILVSGNKSVNYILSFIDEKNAELIAMQNNEAAINIIYSNLKGIPVEDEPINIKGTNSKSEYKLRTLANGTALAIVPSADEYKISLRYFPNVFKLDMKKEQNVIYTNTVRLKYPSSKEFENQKKDEASRILKRDSLYIKYEKRMEVKVGSIEDQLKSQAATAINELIKNPKYFERENNEVCAVLNRNKHTWKTRVIVTDVTGSMFPYMKQVALWHLLELMSNDNSDYVFFNDGDNIPDNLKEIGKTGGIYFNSNDIPDSVIKTMDKAMSNGGGGDAPENNIEALLKAVDRKKSNSEIVLIADNLSPVKDMILLGKLNTPVRVIVCGSKNGYIHPDYLEITYRSGGSIHTIEEDINNLSNLRNEDTITISGKTYKFIQGHFFPIS
jgi:hypothetical protein